MPVLVVPLPVDQEASQVLAPLAGVHVRDEHVLQSQVKAFVLRGVGQEEERPEAQRDEGLGGRMGYGGRWGYYFISDFFSLTQLRRLNCRHLQLLGITL